MAAAAGTPVEHKTGTLNGLADDVGFITMPDGHRIAVAIFARGGSNRPQAIAEAARAIYDGFKSLVDLAVPPGASPPIGCSSTSSLEERSAALRKPIWSSAI